MAQVHDLRKKPASPAPKQETNWDPPGRGLFDWWDLAWFGEPILWALRGLVTLFKVLFHLGT